MANRFLTVMFSMQFLIYNIVPYFTLAFIHYKNFKPDPKQHEETFPSASPAIESAALSISDEIVVESANGSGFENSVD